MKRENHLDFMTNRKNKYSIRKFSVGAASILVGSMIFISPQVEADETTDDEVTEEVAVEEEQDSTEDEAVQNEEGTDGTEEPTEEEQVEEEENEEEVEEGTEDEEEEEEGTEDEEEETEDAPQTIDEAYKYFSMTGYAGEQPDIYGSTAENGTITVILPNGEEYVFQADETGNVDEVFPVALEDNTEITVILADSEGGTYQETLLYTSSPAEDEDDPEEEVPEEDEQPDDGEDDDSNEDGQEGDSSEDDQDGDEGSDDGQEDGDDTDEGQEGDGSEDDQDDSGDSDDGQDDEDTDDEETPDSEEPPLSESSYFSANLSGYEGDGYLTIDGSAPANTVVTLTMPDGSVEEVTVDESGSFSVEIDEYPVGSEVNVHFLFEDDSEFEDDLEIKYLGDEDEDDSEDDQDGDVDDSDDGQEDGDDTDEGQDDGEESVEDQDGDDSEELDEDEITYSYLEDYGTGIMVHSNSAELLNLTLSVEVLSPSALIEEPHDLYDIEILDEDGNEYDLSNPVTVSIPADGSVANVYHLGENGETVESVPYSVEDGYVVFEVSDFSQYAVAYNEGAVAESEDDGTSAVSEDAGDDTAEGQVDAADGDGAVTPVDQDAGDGNEVSGDEAEELPDTGVAENGLLYSIATLLGALGLGSLVFSRRRRN